MPSPLARALKYLVFALFGLGFQVACADMLVRYPRGVTENDFRYNYPVQMLQLALDKTEKEYGPARVVQAKQQMTTARTIAALERGDMLDVATFPTSRDLETQLEPIRICIRKGILGIRLFLIDKNQQEKFAAIKSLEGLARLNAGQGQDWLDTAVLRANDLPVITSSSYEGLFTMLMAHRFDYFPRGLHEPFVELQQNSARLPNLAVEETLALYYPFPDYFFVRKGNTQLAQRIRKGLEMAIADGSYDKLFHKEFDSAIQQAKLPQRRILRLKNPEVDQLPHAGDPRYWLIP